MTETTNTAPSPIPRFRLPAGVGWTLKLLLILFLLVPALIALALITSMVRDRENFERDAIRDIAERWGGEQRIAGPFLTLTCTDTFTRREEREGLPDVIRMVEDRETYSFTAESVDLSVDLAPESRRRGLFQAIVYSATAQVDATFASKAALEERLPKPRGSRDCAFEETLVSMGVSDAKRLSGAIELAFAGSKAPARPQSKAPKATSSGFHGEFDLSAADAGTSLALSTTFDLKGSRLFTATPTGRVFDFALGGAWADPGFTGPFAATYEPQDDRFDASWSLTDIAHGVPDYWLESSSAGNLGFVAVGAELIQTMRPYKQLDRATKYGLLFFFVLMGFYFFSEVLSRRRLHPIQYATVLVPAAMFYILLLALSEHIGFTWAYVVAAAGTVGSLVMYSSATLGSLRRAVMMGGLIALLYTYLYFLLRLESYAFIVGAIGLFLMMVGLMALTRRIDCYALSSPGDTAAKKATDQA